MKYLFIHQNFPGQYLHVIRHLIAQPGNEVAFITEPNKNNIPGVRRMYYQVPPPRQDGTHANVRDLNTAMMRAEAVSRVARNLKRLGFHPDVIVGHHGWGELLDIVDVWPGVPVLGYFEFYYVTHGQDAGFDPEFPLSDDQFPRIRAMNSINLLALALGQHGQTPTAWQKSLYPDWAQRQIRLLREGVHLDTCKPDPKARTANLEVNGFTITPKDRLVTYVARNLEPYRGFHVMMRALPELLKARPDVKVVMVGGDEVSYGARLANATWKEHFTRELSGRYDASRVLMPGQVPYETHVKLLQRSDAHVYLTYPFVPSWSMREALACGCALVAADVEPVREFVTDGQNGLLTPCLDPRLLAERIQEVLGDDKLSRRIRTGARKFAEAELDIGDHIAGFESIVREIVGATPKTAPSPNADRAAPRRREGRKGSAGKGPSAL